MKKVLTLFLLVVLSINIFSSNFLILKSLSNTEVEKCIYENLSDEELLSIKGTGKKPKPDPSEPSEPETPPNYLGKKWVASDTKEAIIFGPEEDLLYESNYSSNEKRVTLKYEYKTEKYLKVAVSSEIKKIFNINAESYYKKNEVFSYSSEVKISPWHHLKLLAQPYEKIVTYTIKQVKLYSDNSRVNTGKYDSGTITSNGVKINTRQWKMSPSEIN